MAKVEEISVDEYLSKRSLSVHEGKMYRSAPSMRSFDPQARSCRFVMTDESVDSYGDEVKADGAKMDRFLSNPIALLNHRSSDVIGQWSDVAQVKKSIEGTMTLANAGTSAEVDKVFNLMGQKILRSASIGFMPLKIEMKRDDKGEPTWEWIIHEWDLYECSVVSIPANPNALAKSMKDGDGMCRDAIEYVLDTYAKMPSGLIVSRADFEKAHKEGSGNKTVVGISVRVADDGKFQAIIDKAFEEAIAKGHIIFEPEIEPDPIVKELEDAMSAFEKKIDDLGDEDTERKGLLSKIFGGIRKAFTQETEPAKKQVKEPEPPALATQEEKDALRRKLLEFEAEELAA